jgi:hypothetical protein
MFAVLCVLSILAYGGAFMSSGLALATWVKRPGRATAWCVGAYALMVVSPVVLSFAVFGWRAEPWVVAGSPFWGTVVLSAVVVKNNFTDPLWNKIQGPAVAWLVIYLAAAVVLHVLTIATFDRCLGRARQGRPSERRVVEHHAVV